MEYSGGMKGLVMPERTEMHKKENGFTLIELIIVVAIIGILFATALPQYQNYQVRAKVVEALVMADSVKTAIEVYHEEHGSWPFDNEEAGLPAPRHISSDYVHSVEIQSDGLLACGIILLKFPGNKNPSHKDDPMGLGALAGTTMFFKPKKPDSGETIEWYCGILEFPRDQYLVPKECRNPRKGTC